MTDNLNTYMRQALARISRIVETARAGGAKEADRELTRLRMLEDLIKEQVPYEDIGSSTRKAR